MLKNNEFNNRVTLCYELFGVLLPGMIYKDGGNEWLIQGLLHNGERTVHDMFAELCREEEMDYPYKDNDFKVNYLKEESLGMIQITIPQSSLDANNIVRAYLMYMDGFTTILLKKYFVVKRFHNGGLYAAYISPQNEVILGSSLEGHADDLEYEQNALRDDYSKLVMRGYFPDWDGDWEKIDLDTIIERILTDCHKCEKGSRHGDSTKADYQEYMQWLKKNMPKEYYKEILSRILNEKGVENQQIEDYINNHLDEMKESLDIIASFWNIS